MFPQLSEFHLERETQSNVPLLRNWNDLKTWFSGTEKVANNEPFYPQTGKPLDVQQTRQSPAKPSNYNNPVGPPLGKLTTLNLRTEEAIWIKGEPSSIIKSLIPPLSPLKACNRGYLKSFCVS